MSASIVPFAFESHTVRTVMGEDNEPLFVAADVCKVLAIANGRDACARLDDDERGVVSTDTLGGSQKMTAITESGLYTLIMGSRKPEAKRFRKWVTSEVLPSIRKTGKYETAIPQTLPEALRLAADLAEKIEQQQAQIECDRPKVAYYETVGDIDGLSSMEQIAKELGITRPKLFAFLREQEMIFKRETLPYREYVDRGLLVVKHVHINTGARVPQTFATQTGHRAIVELYNQVNSPNLVLPL